MTRSSREQHIAQALSQYREHQGATRDTYRAPLRGSTILEVIEIPLDIPILNADSFRIAPRLADHPKADLVATDPESPAAQQVVAELVRQSHRQVDDLKQSLLDEGQDQPGIISRSGKLINANTRCVLLRELAREGRTSATTLRVAVLPADVTNSEELALESVLQKQREYKDDYNLVSELMMIEKLYSSAGMSDQQIAASLRTKGGAKKVTDLREVLVLMNRARHLSTVPRPLAVFVSEQDQTQNWIELLRDVREIDIARGRGAADDHIRRWLLAYYSGNDSVHRLRAAKGEWVEREVVSDLAESNDPIAVDLAEAAIVTPESDEGTVAVDVPSGLDLLGGDEAEQEIHVSPAPVQNLLDIVVAAEQAGTGNVTLPDGKSMPAEDARVVLHHSVKSSLEALKRRAADTNRITRPLTLLSQARSALKDAVDALEDVVEDPAFAQHRASIGVLAYEAQELVEEIVALVADGEDAGETSG